MHPCRFGLGIFEQTLEAFVTPLSRLLVSTKRLGHIAVVEAVDPNDARLQAAHRFVCLRASIKCTKKAWSDRPRVFLQFRA